MSIVVPAYNEEARIVTSLRSLVTYLSDTDYTWEVVVADDGSTDATASLVETLIENHSGEDAVRLLRLPHRGKGAAVKAGMLEARGRFRMMCDADLAMPVEWIAEFVTAMERGHDLVIGSRQIAGAMRFNEPAVRHVMGRLFNWCVRLVTGSRFEDTQCGFKCFTARAAETIFPLQRTRGFGFDVEVLFLATREGMKIIEMPIHWYHQPDSKVRPVVDSVLMLRDALAIRVNSVLGRYS